MALQTTYLADMLFLRDVLYPVVGNAEDMLVHDSWNCGSCVECR